MNKLKREEQQGPWFYTALFLTGIFFLNFLSRVSFSPLMPWIEQDLGLTHTRAGSLFLFLSLGYFLSLLGSGYVASLLGHRKTIAFSASSLGIGLITLSLASGFAYVRSGVFMVGAAAGLYLPSGIATLTDIAGPHKWGKVIAVHELAPNLAFIAAPFLADHLVPLMGWQGFLAAIGVVALVGGVLFPVAVKAGDFPGHAPGFSTLGQILSTPAFWIMVYLFAMGITGTLGIYNMLPLYLVERGLSPENANNLLAFSRVSTLGTALLGGFAADRFGPGKTMSVVLLVTGIMTILLGLTRDIHFMSILVFLQPVLAVCFFPSAFAAISSTTTPEARNLAISLTVPLSFVAGAGLIPAMIGFLGDSGNLGLGFSLAGGLMLSGSPVAFFKQRAGTQEESNQGFEKKGL